MSGEAAKMLEGVRFVIDLGVEDIELLLAALGTALEHPQMQVNRPETMAVRAELLRIRGELSRAIAEQLENGVNRRQVQKVVRRRWTRREEGDAPEGAGPGAGPG